MPGKIPVALIAARYRHHRTRTVAGQNIVANPDRDRLFGKRMLRIRPGKSSRNGFYIGHTLALTPLGSRFDIGIHLSFLLWSRNFLYKI